MKKVEVVDEVDSNLEVTMVGEVNLQQSTNGVRSSQRSVISADMGVMARD